MDEHMHARVLFTTLAHGARMKQGKESDEEGKQKVVNMKVVISDHEIKKVPRPNYRSLLPDSVVELPNLTVLKYLFCSLMLGCRYTHYTTGPCSHWCLFLNWGCV